MKHSKIAIIGAGFVGSTTAYALLLKKITAEIILVDIDTNRCHGEVLDLSDALSFNGTSYIRRGNAQDAAQADIIIIAAGKPQKPSQTRMELLTANKPIIDLIFNAIKPINSQAIIIIVTNPLDILTYYAQTISGLPKNQLFGTGTFLDTLRLRGIISEKAHVSKESINAYVLGEHGDSQFVAWSSATISGIPINMFPDIDTQNFSFIEQKVKNIAYEIISCKGATYFGIATCVAIMCEAIVFNQQLVMPLSVYSEKYKVCLSLPAVLGENGIEKVLPLPLNDSEQEQLDNSAHQLRIHCS
ncbi:MAG TPA: L-lactate dehydrogenase [Candidatus Babeliales bacterium]|nr:L-lactate dehydrogenase [Candidatus Babeliales bacterium]